MADQLPAGLTADESSFQPIGASSGSSATPPQGLSGDESSFTPLSSGSGAPEEQEQEGPTPQTFTTPSGRTFNIGQSVQHSDGTHGEIIGQHPDTGNAVIKYHMPPAKNWKQGEMVRVNGEPSTVVGYTNNGKLLVEGQWGKFGGTKAVSPADIDDNPGEVTSAASGFANSLLKTGTGVAHIFGAHPQGLENAQANAQQAQQANPASGKAGELAADLVQFLAANGIVKAGTGAVAALPAVEQYAQAAKITKVLADHPALARILHAGINGAITQGGISGVQSGGDLGEAAKGAAAGAALEGAGEFAPEVLGAAKKVGSAIAHPIDTAGSVIGTAAKKGGELVQGVTDKLGQAAEKYTPELYPKEINVPSNVEQQAAKIQSRIETQPAYEQHASDIRKAFVNGLKEKGVDLNIPNDVDVRKIPDLANKALENEYKPLYGKVDEALEDAGYTQKYQDAEDNIKDLALKARAESDPEKAAKIAIELKNARGDMDTMNAILKDKGLGDAVKRATDLRKQAHAIDEVKTKILQHTQDLNGTLPRTDPNEFNRALNNLKYKKRFGGNRLDQAFGEKHGAQLMADTRAAQTRVGDLTNAEKLRVAGVQDLKQKAADVAARRAKTEKFASGIARTVVGGGVLGGVADLLK